MACHTSTPFTANLAVFAIETLEMLEGDLPILAQKLIKEWAGLYKQDLLDMWNKQEFR